ncbi:MAG: hypothetical protein R6W67_08105 [Bacteroidales bacterium]
MQTGKRRGWSMIVKVLIVILVAETGNIINAGNLMQVLKYLVMNIRRVSEKKDVGVIG